MAVYEVFPTNYTLKKDPALPREPSKQTKSRCNLEIDQGSDLIVRVKIACGSGYEIIVQNA